MPSDPPEGTRTSEQQDPDPAALFVWTGVPVGRGVSGASWVAVAGNARAAIGKRNGTTLEDRYTIYNEIIAYRIAQHLRLPMADGFIHRPRDAEPFFVQLNFNPQTDFPPAIDAAAVVRDMPALAAKILLFDILVVNTDRHRGNLASVRSGQGEQVYVYDHSHALLGGKGHAPGPDRLKRDKWLGCDGAIGNRYCLLPLIDNSEMIDAAISEVEGVPDDLISTAILEARSNGFVASDARLVETTLQKRRDGVREIVRHNKDRFRAISQWFLGG